MPQPKREVRAVVAMAALVVLVAAGATADRAQAAMMVPAESCQGRTVLVFEDADTQELAVDGMLAWIGLLTDKDRPPMDLARDLVDGLKAGGCTVEHWKEPLVSISVVDGKKTAFLPDGKKEEPYRPRHKLTGKELERFDVVVWVRQEAREHRKQRQGEALQITFRRDAEVRARGRRTRKLDSQWRFMGPEAPPYSSIADTAATDKAVKEAVPGKAEAEAQFARSVLEAVTAGLAPAS
jgi:hypothetical protein